MSDPVRVLFLETVMDRGGAETMTMNYFRCIDRTKIEFDFLVHRDYKAAYEDEITELGGKIYRCCPPYPQYLFKYYRTVKKLLIEHPEYKIIHGNMMEHGAIAYFAAKRMNIPVRICHAHTSGDSRPINIRNIILWIYRKITMHCITHKFACGEKAAKWIFGDNNVSDVVYMKNAIDARAYQFDSAIREAVRDEFELEGKFVIGHVGRFFEPKNHPFIIDTFYEVSKIESNAVLMLVGGGELDDVVLNATKEKVKKLGIENRVIFTGVRQDVNKLLQAFDIFILPSLREGLPVVMVEAQASGLHCIVSDRVPKECDITGNVDRIPLEIGPKAWAEQILSYKNEEPHLNTLNQIIKAGYDIHENTKWLEQFYLNELQRTREKKNGAFNNNNTNI